MISIIHRLQNRASRLSFFALFAVASAIVAGPGARVSHAAAIDTFVGKVVGSIDFKGLKRIEREAVLAKLVTKVGQPLTQANIRSDIEALFGMGFFDDIAVDAEMAAGKVALTYIVRERPVISSVDFEGNERISTSDLKDVIKVKEWSILDVNKVKEDTTLIQKHYEDKGFYLAKVSFEIKPVKPGEVALIYKINDYDKVEIKKITFLNNKHFSDEELKSVFQDTREGGFLSFLSGSGNFKESAFKMDLQRLMLWYLDHGYVKFRYENPVVTVSDDKRWLYISIYVDEGEQYKMGTVDFGGDLLFSKEELRDQLTLLPDQIFSITKRNMDIQKLTEKYQDLGYAFVNVVPKMNIHDDTKTVDVEYDFEKGNLVYFGEINITGNTKTLDYVIRRELLVHEGELFNGTKLRLSQEAVERLGFFQPGEVLFNKVTPKGKLDTLNIEIQVKERSTGSITLGAGYGSVTGIFFTTQISEINLFGRGQNLSLAVQYSADELSQSINLGFTDPYAFDTLWSMGGDIYKVLMPIPNKYIDSKLGFDYKLGHPIADYTYAYITYRFEGLQTLYPDPSIPPDLIADDQGTLSSVIWSIIRDKRNNRFETTGGDYQSATLETAGLGGDKTFIKWTVNNRVYTKFLGEFVFRNSTETGNIYALGNNPIPPSEKFYLGGPNNMKGFYMFLLSPVVFSPTTGQAIPLGGTYEFYSLFELEHPLIPEAGIKLVVFFDVGNSWDHFPLFDSGGFTVRADAGFGIRWFSPIGPLRFELGYPINPRPYEQQSVFNFFIGPPF